MSKSIFKNVVTIILVITMIVSLNNSIQALTNRYNFSIYYSYFQHHSNTYQMVVPVSSNGYDLIISSIYGAINVSCPGSNMTIDEPGTYHFNYYPSDPSNQVAFTLIPDFSSSYIVYASGSLTSC